MRTTLALPSAGRGLTLPELARMMREAIRTDAYQRETRLGAAVADYLAWARLNLAPRSLVIYEGYLARLCETLAAADPSVDEVTPEQLLLALSGYKHGSLRIVRTSYSNFFTWACRWGRCDKNPVDLLPRIREPATRVYDVFTAAEQAQILKATDLLPLPWLQRLRVLCFLDLGVRSSEARGLQVGDFDTVSRVVVVTGKGNKERVVPLSDELWRVFVQFRNRPLPKVRMVDERGGYRQDRAPLATDFLFFPYGIAKSRTVNWTDPTRQLTDRPMRTWWDHVIETAGVRYRSLHMARHTLATEFATAEVDVLAIGDWLGHADPSTTKIYVHNSRTRLQHAMERRDAYRKAQG